MGCSSFNVSMFLLVANAVFRCEAQTIVIMAQSQVNDSESPWISLVHVQCFLSHLWDPGIARFGKMEMHLLWRSSSLNPIDLSTSALRAPN